MNPLRTIQLTLIWCCFCFDETSTKWQKLVRVAFITSCIISMNLGVLSSVVFFIKHVSTNLEDALYALGQILGVTFIIYAILVLCISRRKIYENFQHLSDIYNKS